MPEPTPPNEPQSEDKTPKVKSFRTSSGSVYTYDSDGKSARFKAATGEQRPRNDVTVFVDLSGLEAADLLAGIHTTDPNTRAYVLEVDEEGKPPRIIRDVGEIKDPNKVAVGVVRNGSYSFFKKASVTPVIGWTPFEYRKYEIDGQQMSSKHVGHEVVDIQYEPV